MFRRVPWWIWASTAFFIIIVAAGVYFVMQYRPPKQFIFATGREGGAYYTFAQEYQKRVAEKGYTMDLLQTAGSVAILQALNSGEAEVGFVQGGTSEGVDTSNLATLASVFYEPLWIFYNPPSFATPPQYLSDLTGKNVAVGENGSGTALLARQLLTDNGVTEETGHLLPIGAADGYKMLQSGNLDALLFVSAPAAPMIRDMLADPKIAVLDITQTLAYHHRYPYLSAVTLGEGSLDLAHNIPSKDIVLLAAAAKLVARDDIPPDIMRLVLTEAEAIHGQGGLLEEQGEFPSTKYVEIPMDEDAQHFLQSGPTGLERYLPYWLASRLEWFIFVILPLLVVAYPLVRIMPMLFERFIRSRIFHWYSEIRKVEQQLPTYSIEQIDEKIEWLDDLHEYLNRRLRVPMFFLSDYYQLRGTLSVAIQRFEKRRQFLQRQQEMAHVSAPDGGEAESTEYGAAGASSASPASASMDMPPTETPSTNMEAPEPFSNGNGMSMSGAVEEPPPIPSPTEEHSE